MPRRSWLAAIVQLSDFFASRSWAGAVPHALALASGVCLLQLSSELPGWVSVLGVALLGLAIWRGPPSLRPVGTLLLGFAWAWVPAALYLGETLPRPLEGRNLVLTGTVASLPEARGSGVRFLFDVAETVQDAVPVTFSGRVRLSWYRQPRPVSVGEVWRLLVRLKRPRGFANPGGFDYEGWLFRQGIRATGYVRSAPDNRRLGVAGPGYLVDRVRQWLRGRLAGVLGDAPALGIVQALVLGDRGGIGPEQWEVLTRTGTNHLIAISGLHIGIMAGLAFFLTRMLWRRAPGLCLRLAAPRAAAVVALFAAGSYAALAGFSVSTLRALIMLAVVMVALMLGRTLRPWAALAAALGLVVLADPLAVLSSGFWLSFGAVAVLVLAMGGRLVPQGAWYRWGRAQWAVAIGLLPLLLYLFGRASLVAPLVNLVAVPLFSLLLLPALLFAVLALLLTGWDGPLEAMARVLAAGMWGLEQVSALPWAAWTLGGRPDWVWLLALGGVLLLLAPRGIPGRWIGALCLLPLGLLTPPRPAAGGFRFTLLDVGQGLAAVVQTHERVLVYDTGPAFASGFNTGAAVVAAYLRERGLRRVDLLVISHADKDHAGGLRGLLHSLPVTRVQSGEPGRLGGVRAGVCRAGMHWVWEGVDFRFLHPGPGATDTGNNSSCVLRIENTAGAVLLPGDAESSVERALLETSGSLLPSRLLVAGHHGSATSSSLAFLRQVSPEYLLFAAGFRNRYGFPRPQVVARARRLGARTLNTAASGALEFRFGADGKLRGPTRFRPEARHYWTATDAR